MNRSELRSKFASRIASFRLDEFDLDLHLRHLSAFERAQILEKDEARRNAQKDNNIGQALTLTVQTNSLIVAKGLVDEKGNRVYGDDELEVPGSEIPAKALDAIAIEILRISSPKVDASKNLNPTPSDSSSSDSQPASAGGT
jgi:hypothetical protein